MSEKRQQLEAKATDTVQRSGYRALSFRTLADEVGIKSSSVHYHFPEKSDLAVALIDSYSADFQALLAEISSRKIGPRAKLDAFAKIFQDVVQAEKFCLCGMMAAEVDSLDSASRTKLANYFRATEHWLAEVIRQGQCELKPEVMARVILSGLEGAILIDRVDDRTDSIRAQRTLIRALVSD